VPVTTIAPGTAPWLSDDDRARLDHHRIDLIRRVHWEGARGVAVTEEMIETTAWFAGLVVAGFEPREAPYHLVTSVVFRDRSYIDRAPRPGPAGGVMTDAPRWLAGQSGHGTGPVVLDWRSAQRHIANPTGGENVIVHEFAHKLDQLNGAADGLPPLPDRATQDEWIQTLGTNFRRLRRRGPDGLVRAYGATNEAEYFAVMSELFFTRPAELRERLPRVYARLADFYRQDPAAA
jgi:Mlc titration factor MtfA (ptsG expression regulator)